MPVPVLYVNIMQDISAELEDPRFEGRIHGMRSAAMQGGCYGPLCRMFHRDRERVKRSKRLGRNIPPVDPAGEASVALSHRVGRLNVGEVALVCAVATPHRAEAFALCSALVEAVKAELPIWKHQTEASGRRVWSNLGLGDGA